MADRKQIPDIMGGLLSGSAGKQAPPEATSKPVSQDAGIPAKQDTSKPVRQHTDKMAKQQDSKPAKQQDSKEPEGKAAPASEAEKIKATFYLSPGAIDALESLQLLLRRQADPSNRSQISKSAIVEAALLLAQDQPEQIGSGLASSQ